MRQAQHPLPLLLAAMVSLIIVGGAPAPAVAHAGHNHHAVKTAGALAPLGAVSVAATGAKATSKFHVLPHEMIGCTFSPRKTRPASDDESSCCCGSFVCHVCVTLPVQEPAPPATGERLSPGLSKGIVQYCPLRLDRPPRTTHSA